MRIGLQQVKADLQRRKIDVAVIPGGLTPVLQPLDKCLNKPFKDNMRRKYLNWMMTGPFEYTPAGKKKAPSKNLVLRWVKQSWEEIPEEMVRRSFKTCGISNALDGSRIPYLGENLPVLSLICWKNRSAYRQINTVFKYSSSSALIFELLPWRV